MTNLLVHSMLLTFIWLPFALLAGVEERLPEIMHRARLVVLHPVRELHEYRLHHHAAAH